MNVVALSAMSRLLCHHIAIGPRHEHDWHITVPCLVLPWRMQHLQSTLACGCTVLWVKSHALQVAIVAPGETDAPYASQFYKALGISNPSSFKPAAPPAEPAATAAPTLWAVEYRCEGADAASGWPLKTQGDEPTAVPGSQVDAVCLRSVPVVPSWLPAMPETGTILGKSRGVSQAC